MRLHQAADHVLALTQEVVSARLTLCRKHLHRSRVGSYYLLLPGAAASVLDSGPVSCIRGVGGVTGDVCAEQ